MSRPTQGFTLIEIVIVTVVVSLVLLGLFSTFNVAEKARNMTNERDLAREACRAKLEELSDLAAVDYGSLAAAAGTTFDVPLTASPSGERLVGFTDGELPGTILVDTTTLPARATLAKVTVQVHWRGQDFSENRVEMSTFIAAGR